MGCFSSSGSVTKHNYILAKQWALLSTYLYGFLHLLPRGDADSGWSAGRRMHDEGDRLVLHDKSQASTSFVDFLAGSRLTWFYTSCISLLSLLSVLSLYLHGYMSWLQVLRELTGWLNLSGQSVVNVGIHDLNHAPSAAIV